MSDDTIEGPRACGPYEFAPTLNLLNQVFFPQEPAMGNGGAPYLCEENRENMRILKVNGRIVAHVGVYPIEIETPCAVLSLGGIWAVACHPDFRRRGFAEACMRDAMDRMRELGCDIGWLGTGINDWYRKFGWENAGRGYSFTIDRATVDLLPELEGCDVGEGPWPDLDAMQALFRRHGRGALRRNETFAVDLGRPHRHVLTASRGGELLAYVLRTGKYVAEYAGDEEIAAGLVREAFRRWDDPNAPLSSSPSLGRFGIETPVSEQGFPGLLRELRLPCEYTWRGMMWIADLGGLLEKLGLCDEIGVERTPSGYRLCRGGGEIELTEREAVKLVFGPEKITDFAEDLFPIEFYHWPLDWV